MLELNIITACWWMFIIIWVIYSFRLKRTSERLHWGGRIFTAGFITLTFLLLASRISAFGLAKRLWPVGTVLWFTACAITAGGLAVAVWARVVLGSNWSATISYCENHELMVRGPYRMVRHPIYTGLLLMIAGTGLAVGSAGGLLSFVVCLLGICWKIRREEALMERYFPTQYPAYKERTKALVPFVY